MAGGSLAEVTAIEPPLVDVMVDGRLVVDMPCIDEMRQRRQADVDRLDAGVKRLISPHAYRVSLTQRLYDLKQRLVSEALGSASGDGAARSGLAGDAGRI